jgi:phosphoribosyl 1,2-cyclic phosphate phosphodiesterase
MEQRGVRMTEHVLLTHAHHDHVAGLPEWADACRWLGVRGRIYAPSDVITACLARYPWLQGFIDFYPNDEGMAFEGWRITPWKVCHGKNGFSYAYRFERDGIVWVYCSDAINLSAEEKAPMINARLLILGTSFYEEPYDFHTRSVYDMVEGLQLVDEVNAEQAIFTHMSHDIDLRKDYRLPEYVRLAYSGLSVHV